MTSLKQCCKQVVVKVFWGLLGRRNLIRLSRFLANEGRLDVKNDMANNGELLLQREVLARFRQGTAMTVFDVGAHNGTWSKAFLDQSRRVGIMTTIHAFEPCPGTFATLTDNLKAWDYAKEVTTNKLALSSSPGQLSLFSLGANQGRNSLYPLTDERVSVETVEVETLDQYCEKQGVERIHLLKIDAEGHDLEVLRGAIGMLTAGRIEAAQFEYNHRWIEARQYLRDAFEFLAPLGYMLGKVTSRGIEFYSSWHIELETFREGNYLAVQSQIGNSFSRIEWWLVKNDRAFRPIGRAAEAVSATGNSAGGKFFITCRLMWL